MIARLQFVAIVDQRESEVHMADGGSGREGLLPVEQR